MHINKENMSSTTANETNDDNDNESVISEQHVEIEGTVTFETKGCFKVKLDSGQEINAKPSGKMRKHKIQIIFGDKVLVECSVYDLNNGRIVRRLTSGRTRSASGGPPAGIDEQTGKKKAFNKKEKNWK